jgi:dCTP deaminase
MFLSRLQIQSRLDTLLEIKDQDDRQSIEENIQDACLDLRVGDEVYLSGEPVPRTLSEDNPYVLLPPGQFGLVKTLERLTMPADYVGLISIRFRYKLQGLTNISGFHVDPHFSGPLIFAVQNVGPNDIRLRYREPMFMIMWAILSPAAPPLPHNSNKRVGPSRITLEHMAQLGGVTMTIASLRNQIDALGSQLKIYGAFAAAALTAILVMIMREIFMKR